MTRDNFVYCNLCLVYMGQLWNLSPVAPGRLPSPDFHVCDDCWALSEPVIQTPISDGAAHV